MFVPNPNSPLIRPDPIQSDPIRSDRVSTRSDPIRIPPPRSGGYEYGAPVKTLVHFVEYNAKALNLLNQLE